MHAGSDRPEFAPPPEPALLRAFALAVLAHLLLVVALTYGLHWKREAQDAAVEAELWSALRDVRHLRSPKASCSRRPGCAAGCWRTPR